MDSSGDSQLQTLCVVLELERCVDSNHGHSLSCRRHDEALYAMYEARVLDIARMHGAQLLVNPGPKCVPAPRLQVEPVVRGDHQVVAPRRRRAASPVVRYPRLGAFEIWVQRGSVRVEVYSRLRRLKWPNPDWLATHLDQVVARDLGGWHQLDTTAAVAADCSPAAPCSPLCPCLLTPAAVDEDECGGTARLSPAPSTEPASLREDEELPQLDLLHGLVELPPGGRASPTRALSPIPGEERGSSTTSGATHYLDYAHRVADQALRSRPFARAPRVGERVPRASPRELGVSEPRPGIPQRPERSRGSSPRVAVHAGSSMRRGAAPERRPTPDRSAVEASSRRPPPSTFEGVGLTPGLAKLRARLNPTRDKPRGLPLCGSLKRPPELVGRPDSAQSASTVASTNEMRSTTEDVTSPSLSTRSEVEPEIVGSPVPRCCSSGASSPYKSPSSPPRRSLGLDIGTEVMDSLEGPRPVLVFELSALSNGLGAIDGAGPSFPALTGEFVDRTTTPPGDFARPRVLEPSELDRSWLARIGST